MPTLGIWSYLPHWGHAGGLQTSNQSMLASLAAYAPSGWSVAHVAAPAARLRWRLAGLASAGEVVDVTPAVLGAPASILRPRAGAPAYRLLRVADRAARIPAQLVFAPDVSSMFKPMDVRVPVIVAPNDLQHRHYPQYFSRAELTQRAWLYRRALDRADLIVVGSEATLDDVGQQYPDAAHKTVLWRFPAPSDLRPPSDTERQSASRLLGPRRDAGSLVLYPAQFWPHKNHQVLVRSLAALRIESGPDVRLVLTGAGRTRDQVARLARQEGVLDRVLFVGNVSRGVLFALYEAAALVAVPSLFEQASYPLLEAGWFGRPVLASDIPPLRGELSGHEGALVDPADPAAWAAALQAALTDESRRDDLVRAGRSALALHDVRTQAEEFWRLGHDLMTRLRS